jgi:hypothetical protein
MMSEAFAIRLLDAFDIGGPHVRVHDGEQLLGSSAPMCVKGG